MSAVLLFEPIYVNSILPFKFCYHVKFNFMSGLKHINRLLYIYLFFVYFDLVMTYKLKKTKTQST